MLAATGVWGPRPSQNSARREYTSVKVPLRDRYLGGRAARQLRRGPFIGGVASSTDWPWEKLGYVDRIMRLFAADLAAERPASGGGDVHFPRALARAVINYYSSPGDRVLGPFAGWGTTLVVAEQLGRSAVGVELLPERSAAIRQQVGPFTVVHTADARDLGTLHLGEIDLCFTSPPYMTAVGATRRIR